MHPGRTDSSEGRVAPAPDRNGPVPTGAGDLVPASWRDRVGVVVGLCALWVLGWSIAVRGGRGPLGVERPLNDLLTRTKGQVDGFAVAVASINHPPVFAAVMVVMLGLCAAGRSPRAALTLVVSLVATLAVCEELKVLVGRRGTFGLLTFPSGHVGVVSVLATVTILLARGRGPLGRRLPRRVPAAVISLAVAAVVTVAAAMVVLGAHYVTDTIAAAPIGLAVTLLAATASDSLGRRSAPGH